MNYMLLVNVLEYFDRENLEKLSIVSRLFEKIVRIEFPQHPFRLFNKLHIAANTNGTIYLGMMHDENTLTNTSNTPPSANVAGFKGGSYDEWGQSLLYFSLCAMLPFMGKSVRFERTIIVVNSTLFSQQSITAMENFAHLWTGRTLKIEHGYDVITPSPPNYCPSSDSEDESLSRFAPEEAVISSCDRIFNSSGVITPCRELVIYRIDMPLSYAALYAINIIRIRNMNEFSASNVLDFVEGLRNTTAELSLCASHVSEWTSRELISGKFER